MKKILLKIIVLGDSGVGKTALMTQYVQKKFSYTYKTTIGADFMAKEITIDDTLIVLQIWDTAGQDRFRSLGTSFYRGADACVLVFDVNAEKSWEHVEGWRNEFVLEAGVTNSNHFPFVVVGNKIDMRTEQSDTAIDSAAHGWCESHHKTPLFFTSAKEGKNVDDVFSKVIELVVAGHAKATPETNGGGGLPIHSHHEEPQEGGGCC